MLTLYCNFFFQTYLLFFFPFFFSLLIIYTGQYHLFKKIRFHQTRCDLLLWVTAWNSATVRGVSALAVRVIVIDTSRMSR